MNVSSRATSESPLRIGMLLFPKCTQLDYTGPFEVFARMPNVVIYNLWKETGPVVTDRGLAIQANATLSDCPQLDVVFVPGGPGQELLMDDQEVLRFLKEQSERATFVTAVCTGSLVLGAAGLLRGYAATSHWSAVALLSAFGATPVAERIVIDRNRVTGGGVTAGIDFGLRLAAEFYGPQTAQEIQLQMEYNPQPPYDSGTPSKASTEVLEAVRLRTRALAEQRARTAERFRDRFGI